MPVKWTSDEDRLLSEMWGEDATDDELAEALSKRTPASIMFRASSVLKLGPRDALLSVGADRLLARLREHHELKDVRNAA